MPPPPPILTEETVLEKCEFFARTDFWSGASRPRCRPWLNNFTGEDRVLAVYLLNYFQYLSETVCHRMFIHSFSRIPRLIAARTTSYASTRAEWKTFLKEVIVAPVSGNRANPTDSGNHYCGLARKVLHIAEDQIAAPSDALNAALSGHPVLFVDDFVGSGLQFVTTWQSTLSVKRSFSNAFGVPRPAIYYCPLVATSDGLAEIATKCPGVTALPLHVLDNTYDLFDPAAGVWPVDLAPKGIALIRRFEADYGIKPKPFIKNALAIAFHNSTPNATHPIFWYQKETWNHLVSRS